MERRRLLIIIAAIFAVSLIVAAAAVVATANLRVNKVDTLPANEYEFFY